MSAESMTSGDSAGGPTGTAERAWHTLPTAEVARALRTDPTTGLTVAEAAQRRERFVAAGYANVINVEGGTMACVEAGLPIVRGKKAVSLERQVRIAAGSLVLLGTFLGWLVHPAFIGLSVFVLAGLLFAGITDTCGVGLLLARMPRNWAGPEATPGCAR